MARTFKDAPRPVKIARKGPIEKEPFHSLGCKLGYTPCDLGKSKSKKMTRGDWRNCTIELTDASWGKDRLVRSKARKSRVDTRRIRSSERQRVRTQALDNEDFHASPTPHRGDYYRED